MTGVQTCALPISRAQARILQVDEDAALAALGKLIKTKEGRSEAVTIARRIALADGRLMTEEKEVLDKIQQAFAAA